MLLKQVNILNFRNLESEKFTFNPFLTIIIGENSRGKTNLLESIFFVVNGQGFRESREEELVTWEKDKGSVEALFNTGDTRYVFAIHLKKNNLQVEKIFLFNQAKKRYFQYSHESTKTVLFSPEQIHIIIGPPQERRNYFDQVIYFYDIDYKKKRINYDNAVRKRNKILEINKDEVRLKEELEFWNQYLEDQASYITKKRSDYVDFLNKHQKIDSINFEIEYLKSEFSKKRAEENFELEKRYRRTLIGPQKDDFIIWQRGKDGKKNLHFFGSRSEQRLGVFWLKFNEVKFFEENLRKKPILLLDDIFSELDTKNKKLIINLIKNYQTIVTTTEVELLDLADSPKSIINL